MRRLLPTALLIAAACGASDGVDRGFAARDSAGVEIVENGAAGALGDSLLTLRQDLRIGSVDGSEATQFFRVFAIDVDARGNLFVVNSGTSDVRVFAPDGTHLRSFGGQGSGPGEFQFPSRVIVTGDSVVVNDNSLYRATVFDTAGTLRDTWPLRDDARSIYPYAPAPGGWLLGVAQYGGWAYEVGVEHRDTTRIAFVASPANALDSAGVRRAVVSIPLRRIYGIASPRTMTANSPVWEPAPRNAFDGAGRIYVSHGSPYRIEVHDAEGALVRVVRRAHEPVPVTDALYDRYFDEVKTYYDTATNRHGEWDIAVSANVGRQALPRVDVLPALGRLYVSREGWIWVERPDLVDDPVLLEWTQSGERQPSYWDVFDADGRFLGTTRFDPGFSPRVAIENGIIGIERDDLDVEHVVRYVIDTPGG